MWKCTNCGASNKASLPDCPRCGFARAALADEGGEPASVAFRVFRGRLATWNSLFEEAATFASTLGSTRLISISHSADQGDGVVTVWYWT